jgi:flagellar protein FliO/FliZ
MKRFRNNSILVVLLTVIVLQIAVCPVAAADMEKLNQELDSQPQAMDKPNLVIEFIKLLVALVLIVAAAWSIIKVFSRQVTSRMQGTWLRVVDEVTLGQNKGIILCEVGEKVFAVGVTDHNISVLFEVTHPKLLEEISMEMENKPANLPSDGLQKLRNALNHRWGKAVPHRVPETNRADFQTLMEEQVKRIQNISSTSLGGSQHDADKESQV